MISFRNLLLDAWKLSVAGLKVGHEHVSPVWPGEISSLFPVPGIAGSKGNRIYPRSEGGGGRELPAASWSWCH